MVFGATPQVRKQTALLQQHLCLQWVSACAWLCIGKHALLNPFLFVTCLGCLACLWGQLETWSSYAKRQMNEESSFCMMNEWWEVVSHVKCSLKIEFEGSSWTFQIPKSSFCCNCTQRTRSREAGYLCWKELPTQPEHHRSLLESSMMVTLQTGGSMSSVNFEPNVEQT